MRLRGFSVMTNIMEDYKEDPEVQLLVRTRPSLKHALYSFWRPGDGVYGHLAVDSTEQSRGLEDQCACGSMCGIRHFCAGRGREESACGAECWV